MRGLLLLALLPFVGCTTKAISTARTDNDRIQVDLLFTHEGCKVYRFEDAGYFRYYAVCGGAATVSSRVQVDKTSRPDELPTVVGGTDR